MFTAEKKQKNTPWECHLLLLLFFKYITKNTFRTEFEATGHLTLRVPAANYQIRTNTFFLALIFGFRGGRLRDARGRGASLGKLLAYM